MGARRAHDLELPLQVSHAHSGAVAADGQESLELPPVDAVENHPLIGILDPARRSEDRRGRHHVNIAPGRLHPFRTTAPRYPRSGMFRRRTMPTAKLGARGQRRAAWFYRLRVYVVVARNVRFRAGEIDLIVRRGGT